jgi:hypothetical protein
LKRVTISCHARRLQPNQVDPVASGIDSSMKHSDDSIHRRTDLVRIHPQHGRGFTDAQVLPETKREHGVILRLERCGHPCRTPSHSIGFIGLLVRHDIVPYDAGPSNVPGILQKRHGPIIRDPTIPLPVESARFRADEIMGFTAPATFPGSPTRDHPSPGRSSRSLRP